MASSLSASARAAALLSVCPPPPAQHGAAAPPRPALVAQAPCRPLSTAAKPSRGQVVPKAVATSAAESADGASNDAEIQDTSAFISDVSNLVKLVDSRDIVELELKHANYEILIRKKEAVAAADSSAGAAGSGAGQQTFPGPHVMAHTAYPWGPPPPSYAAPAPPPTAAPAPTPVAAPAAPPPPAPSAASALPPMLSPMAGTFYRSPAPGEPSFVKVGDRISKGQVVCIIEAMKLMNEIEADQSGEIVEFLVESGKPVSIESPLLRIKP